MIYPTLARFYFQRGIFSQQGKQRLLWVGIWFFGTWLRGKKKKAWKVKSFLKTVTETSLSGTRELGRSSEDPPWQMPPDWG